MAHRRPIRAETMHHRSAIAIRDINRSIRPEGDITRRVEGLTGTMPLANPAQPFAVAIKNDDFLRVAIHDKNAPIRMDGKHVPIRHFFLTPGSDALTVWGKHHNGRPRSARVRVLPQLAIDIAICITGHIGRRTRPHRDIAPGAFNTIERLSKANEKRMAGHAVILHRWMGRIMPEAHHGVEWCPPL